MQDLELTRSTENDTLDVTWTEDWLQDRCGVRYTVIYEHGTINITTMVNQPNVTFDVAYCAPTTVRVRTTHNNRLSDERNVTLDTGKVKVDSFNLANLVPFLYTVNTCSHVLQTTQRFYLLFSHSSFLFREIPRRDSTIFVFLFSLVTSS